MNIIQSEQNSIADMNEQIFTGISTFAGLMENLCLHSTCPSKQIVFLTNSLSFQLRESKRSSFESPFFLENSDGLKKSRLVKLVRSVGGRRKFVCSFSGFEGNLKNVHPDNRHEDINEDVAPESVTELSNLNVPELQVLVCSPSNEIQASEISTEIQKNEIEEILTDSKHRNISEMKENEEFKETKKEKENENENEVSISNSHFEGSRRNNALEMKENEEDKEKEMEKEDEREREKENEDVHPNDSVESKLIKLINDLPPGGTLKHKLATWEGKISIKSQLYILKHIQRWELSLAFLGWMKPKLTKMSNLQKNAKSKPKITKMSNFQKNIIPKSEISKMSNLQKDAELNPEITEMPNFPNNKETVNNNTSNYYEYVLLCAHNIVLNKLGKEKKWNLMEKMMNDMIMMGLKPDSVSYKSFINAYGYDNNLLKAEEWFWKMAVFAEPVDSQICFVFLNHYRRCNKFDKLIDNYEKMKSKLCIFDRLELCHLLLEAYASLNNINEVKSIIEEMKIRIHKINIDACHHVVVGLVRAKNKKEAKNILELFIEKGINISIDTWHHVMHAFASEGNFQETHALFKRMENLNLNLSIHSYDHLLHACKKEKLVEEGERITNDLKQKNISFSSKTYAHMIDLYVHSKQYKNAISLFQKSVIHENPTHELSFCAMMRMYGKLGLVHEARRIFAKLRKQHSSISSKSYSIMMDIFCNASLFIQAEELYKESQRKGKSQSQSQSVTAMELDVVLHNTMLKVYSKWRRHDDAMRIFQKMKSLSLRTCIITYSTLIHMYGQHGQTDKAKSLYEEMLAQQIPPNDHVISSLLFSYLESRQFCEGILFWEGLVREGYEPSVEVCSLVIEMLGLIGRGTDAIDLFESTVKKNSNLSVKIFNAMSSTYALMQRHDDVIEMYDRMVRLGVEMDMDAYASFIHALRRLGKYEEALDMTATMHRYLENIPSSQFII